MNPDKRKDGRKALGARGEAVAAVHLKEQGFIIVASNWRCRSGELDLIAEKDGLLVFIEVRTRTKTGTFGTPQESVTARKQKQVRETAQFYMYACNLLDKAVRFDVICLQFARDGTFLTLDHIEDAF
jgi:putative endonuclease